ncbi:MAG: sulfite exporter TauE/SafE family protein [Verrucomicrobiaceae bacterium]
MPTIDTTASAFVAGLVTSIHCAGMCGPLACAWLVGGSNQLSHPLRDTSLYHAARLTAYGIVGAAAGALGVMPLRWFNHGAGVVLPWLLVLAFLIVALGLDRWLPKPRFLSKPIAKLRLRAMGLGTAARATILGLGTPLLPCGPLYLMFALAMAGGSAIRGAEFTVAFGLGTLPLLALMQTTARWLNLRTSPVTMRRVQRGMALAAALVMVWRLRGTLTGETELSCCH